MVAGSRSTWTRSRESSPTRRPAATAPPEPAAPGQTEGPADLGQQIERVAREHGLPGDLIRAVVWAESGFREDAMSPAGAVGLMQLMPGTAAELGVDPLDAAENLAGGARYLRRMLERFEGDPDQLVKALAAYNAGPGPVAEHGGLPPYEETIAYVGRVVRRFLDSPAQSVIADARTGANPSPETPR